MNCHSFTYGLSSSSVFKLLANAFIYVCAITVGVMSYYMADRKHRKAFLEARQSLEVKLNLEEQSQQQVIYSDISSSSNTFFRRFRIRWTSPPHTHTPKHIRNHIHENKILKADTITIKGPPKHTNIKS